MARRFIAGETLDEAVAVVRELNQRGTQSVVAMNHLGENVANDEGARRAVVEYQHLLQRVGNEGIQSSISVKLTQVGLDLREDFCYDQVRAIVEMADVRGLTVEVDIEGSQYTQATLNNFHRLLAVVPPPCKDMGLSLSSQGGRAPQPAVGAAGLSLPHRERPETADRTRW